MPSVAALIVAGGRGTRAATGGVPKQYVEIGGRTLLAHTLDAVLSHERVEAGQVVIHPDDHPLYARAVAETRMAGKLVPPVTGGDDRQASVRNGLAGLAATAPTIVLIHDAARPFVTHTMLDSLFLTLRTGASAILASRATDTIKRSDPRRSLVVETIPRETIWRAETPQAFRYDDIMRAHRKAELARPPHPFTDDASIAEWAGLPVTLVDSGGANTKITTAEDLAMAELRLAGHSAALPDIRTGQGFDVHRFKPGDHVMICGVRIVHTHGVDAHSDGDVGLHALTDALLGAIADGDIGQHFKNTDPRWQGRSSDHFLDDARRRVATAGGTILNVDVTVLCEAPKIAPHREAMRARMAAILGIDVGRVSVKATTTERLGFAGRGEGLAAMATASVGFLR